MSLVSVNEKKEYAIIGYLDSDGRPNTEVIKYCESLEEAESLLRERVRTLLRTVNYILMKEVLFNE